MTDAKQRVHAWWLRRRELQAIEASLSTQSGAPQRSPIKASRIAAIGVAAIVTVAVVALVVGIPVPFLAKAIAKRFEAETGYRLLIAGSAKIKALPSTVVTVSDISVLDGSDSRAQIRFAAEGVRIKMSFWSLILGRPRLTELAIASPTLRLPVARERAVQASSRPAPSKPGRALPQSLTVDRLVVEDGTVEFVTEANQAESRVDSVNLTGSLSGDHVLAVKASARVGEQSLRAGLKGKLPAGRDVGQVAAMEFTVDAPGLLQETATGKAEVKTSGSLLTISALTGAIGPSKFSGLASVDFAGKPVVKLDLDFRRLDLAIERGDAPGAIRAPGSPGDPWSDRAVNLDGLNFFDAEMQISAAEFRIDKFRFAPISVGAILAKGVLTAGIVRTGMYGGQVQGTVVVDASRAEPSHAIRIDLTGVRALPLLSDVANFSSLDGRMQAKIDAQGQGKSLRAVMSTLSGAVDLLVQDGEVRNVNVAKMIRTLTTSTLSGWQEDKAEKTDLTQLGAFFRIAAGQATTDNLRLFGPLVRVTGTGTTDLGAKTLQFRVEPKLVLSLQGQGGAVDPVGIGVPVVVQGSWGAPRIYPDVAGILDNPDAAYAKLRELGAGLFGTNSGIGLPGSPGNPLPQSIETLIDRLGGDRKDDKTQPSVEKPPSPPTPPPRPAPQAQSRPQPQPPPPQAQPAPAAQSSSQSKPASPGGPFDFFQKLLGR
jgi:AsmA protein